MKLSIALLTIGTLCLSSVEALRRAHKQDDSVQVQAADCAEDDDQCWFDNLQNCDVGDDRCIALSVGVQEDDLPDCQNGDQQCWSNFWKGLFSSTDQQQHNKLGRGDGHAKKFVQNHYKLGRGDGHLKKNIAQHNKPTSSHNLNRF